MKQVIWLTILVLCCDRSMYAAMVRSKTADITKPAHNKSVLPAKSDIYDVKQFKNSKGHWFAMTASFYCGSDKKSRGELFYKKTLNSTAHVLLLYPGRKLCNLGSANAEEARKMLEEILLDQDIKEQKSKVFTINT